MTMHEHPQALRTLCAGAAELFEALAGQDLAQRASTLARLREMLGRIDEAVKELDLRDPDFPREQGWLMDAASALQSIEVDRGGPAVERFAARAAADLRRVAEGSSG